jgi:hypothetical protein
LAGDLDLWKRSAKHSDLIMVDTILGCFRVREGQLSTNMAKYYAEADASLTPDDVAIRAKVSRRYRWAGFDYYVLLRHSGGPWTRERLPMRFLPLLGSRTLRRGLNFLSRLARRSA